LPSGTHQRAKRIVRNRSIYFRLAPVLIPRQQTNALGIPAPRVFWIASAEETAPTFACFVPYAVPAGIGRPVRHTILRHMNINSWPQRTVKILGTGPLDNLFSREIPRVRPLAVEQSDSNPNLVGDLQFRFNDAYPISF
jgi:hypothetical protein